MDETNLRIPQMLELPKNERLNMTCTAEDCDTEATLHLCEHHRLELKDLLEGVNFLIVNLDPLIQSGKVTRKVGGQEGSNGNKAGSKPPTTDTQQIRYWLWQLPTDAYKEARDNPHAGKTLYMAKLWVGKARVAVYGTEPEEVDHAANRERVANIAPPMTTRQLLPWLRKNSRITITSQNVRDWARRGHLKPVTREPQPTYHPHEVLNAWHERNN